jgi:two-component system sensor histidine kinase RegB
MPLESATPATAPPERELTLADQSAPVAGADWRGRPDAYIVLTWLIRLRWFAMAGQGTAILLASYWFELALPLPALGAIMSVTIVTNLILMICLRTIETIPRWLIFAVLLSDVILLTAMLAATGGWRNPFSLLYLIHVAMAVVVLPPRWTWTILGESLVCFSLLFVVYVPLDESRSPRWMLPVGGWVAVAIAAGLIAYFVGRLRTTLHDREEQMAQMQQRMTLSERLASLTTLAAGAAHELGTPLGTIAVVTHELERQAVKLHLPQQAVEDVRLIRDEVGRCRRILDRMNIDNLQRSDEPAVTMTVGDLLAEIKSELKPGQEALLDVTVSPAMNTMTVRRDALVQTIGILMQNAFDASEQTQSRVSLSLALDGGDVRLIVEDQGVGMSTEQMKRLGEPFVTTKGPQRGMGLGLFLARLMAEHMRGSLRLRSAVGKGTTSVLTFPVQWR